MRNEKREVSIQSLHLKQKKFIKNANSAIREIEKEIGKPKRHKIENLQFIKEEIEKMKVSLSSFIFKPNYPIIIVDHWNPKDELGNILLKLYYIYLELN